jgi:small subunit ribosomal protein S6
VEDKTNVALYETLFVVHPEKGSRMKEFIERFKKIVEAQAGTVASVEEWGLRDLAYRIDKQGKGVYALMKYESSARAVQELERNLKLTDGILRYLTVRADPHAVPASSPAVKPVSDEQKPAAASAEAEQETAVKTE